MGCSGGGFGVMANLDYVADMIPQVKVKGWSDSGFYPFIHVTEG